MSMPGRYLDQQAGAAYNQRDAQGLGNAVPVRDTVHSRLDSAVGVLVRCEMAATALGEKLLGQSAGKDNAPAPPPSGVHGLAQDVHARAMRLEQLLGAINEVLA